MGNTTIENSFSLRLRPVSFCLLSMKQALSLVFLAAFAAGSEILNEEKAKSVLRFRRGLFKGPVDLKKHPKGQYDPCPFAGHLMCDKAGEYWEDVKDDLEKTRWAPEDMVDALEKCVTECKKEEGIVSWGGAFRSATNEEKLNNYEEALEEHLDVAPPKMKDCNRCIVRHEAIMEANPNGN